MPEEHAITESDLETFVQKLDAWGEGLGEREQTLLRIVLSRANGEESDVEGFEFGDAFGHSAQAFLIPLIQSGLTSSPIGDSSAWHEWIRDWDRTDPDSSGEFTGLER